MPRDPCPPRESLIKKRKQEKGTDTFREKSWEEGWRQGLDSLGAPPALKSGYPQLLPHSVFPLSGPVGPGPRASTHISYKGLCPGAHGPEEVPKPWQAAAQKTRPIPWLPEGGRGETEQREEGETEKREEGGTEKGETEIERVETSRARWSGGSNGSATPQLHNHLLAVVA